MKKIVLVCIASVSFLSATPLGEYLLQLSVQAKREDPSFSGFDAKRGEKIFYSEQVGKRGEKISCASCHTKDLTSFGENYFTGKKIEPLAPVANPKRLGSVRNMKKWLKRNFKDVYNKEGTAQQKGDVLIFISTYGK